MDKPRSNPRVGVAVILLRDGKVLLGKRLGSLGNGTWALPGGHLEFGESIEDCARREVLEETGLMIGALQRGPYFSNVFAAERSHYVTLFLIAEEVHGEAQALEPEKCAQWFWFHWSALPVPLFPSLQHLVASGFDPARIACGNGAPTTRSS